MKRRVCQPRNSPPCLRAFARSLEMAGMREGRASARPKGAGGHAGATRIGVKS